MSDGSAESGAKPERYARLAAEYSKLRSYLGALKKAVSEEKAANAELKEAIRERDLRLRKGELEIDSLSFRNRQLTKRVSVLQDDAESLQLHKNAKKGKHKKDDRGQRAADCSADEILQEELQKKIIENARLLSEMADKDFEKSQLNLQVTDLEKQLADAESKYKIDVQKLNVENRELTNSLECALSCKEKSCLNNQSTSNRNLSGALNSNQAANGDFASDVGSLIGSEDALSTEESLLNERLKKKTEQLIQVEQENQTLKIELDLLKLEINSLKSNKKTEEEFSQPDVKNRQDSPATIIGMINSPITISEEILCREEKLKSYFRKKLSDLIAEKQQCESMIQHYLDENEGLKIQSECLKKEKQIIEDGIAAGQSTIHKLEDELHSTTTNYEQQVILLTEHVGNLNDKLAQQAEEIQKLKGNMCIKK